jgi:two-component system sensor histidine kinase DesK
MAAGNREDNLETLRRLASGAAIAFTVAFPLVFVLNYAADQLLSQDFLLALGATALYLPLHLRHVIYGIRGVSPPARLWSLAAMAGIIIGFTPALGGSWLFSYSALAASVLVTTRRWVAFPLLICLLVGVGIWASAFGAVVAETLYLPVGVLDRSMVVFVLVWLVGVLGRVRSARVALADAAVAAERSRVDDELRATVGAELESVVREGERSLDEIGRDSPKAEQELRALVERSRHVQAEVRRVIRGYQAANALDELEKAAALLRAAGIEVTIAAAVGDLPISMDSSLSALLRSTVSQLLGEESTRKIVLSLEGEKGSYRIEVTRDTITGPPA